MAQESKTTLILIRRYIIIWFCILTLLLGHVSQDPIAIPSL